MEVLKRFAIGAGGFLLFTSTICAAVFIPMGIGFYLLGPVGIPIGGLSAVTVGAGLINVVMG